MHGLGLLLLAAVVRAKLDCSKAAKWTKEDVIRPKGSGPAGFTKEEIASVGADFEEVPLECLGIKKVEPWEAKKVDGDLNFPSPQAYSDFVTASNSPFKSNSTVPLECLGIKKVEPWEAKKVDEDLNFPSPQAYSDFVTASNSPFKSALGDTYSRWPNGVVPYSIDGSYGTYARNVILSAIKHIEASSCITFSARRSERDYVYIFPDKNEGCYSLVGRSGRRQDLSIDEGCVDRGTVVHELLHALGFIHEQSRPDRDEWEGLEVRIEWSNLEGYRRRGPDGEIQDQFVKYSIREMASATMNVGYDYGSIMHYSPYAFSRNGRATIVGLKSGSSVMGQRTLLSTKDALKLNRLYNCPTK